MMEIFVVSRYFGKNYRTTQKKKDYLNVLIEMKLFRYLSSKGFGFSGYFRDIPKIVTTRIPESFLHRPIENF